MVSKKAAEALQFDFIEEEPASRSVNVPSGSEPTSSPVPAKDHPRMSHGLQLAREVLASGAPPLERSADTAGSGVPLEAPGLQDVASDSALSVAEFYERVTLALRSEFPDEVWVTGEIRKVTVARTGHRYLELADHDPEGRTDSVPQAAGNRSAGATLDVACWSRSWPPIAGELASVGVELAAGLVVRVRGRVSVWEAGAKIRFSMTALDVEALVGGIAAARRKLIMALEAEGVLEANRRLPEPPVPLRVGLVTSAGSEAYRDFTGQLQRSAFAFDTRLEPTLVQGPDAPLQIAAAIGRLQAHDLDVIVVVRGGGAKGDLAAFDHEVVARAIIASRCPVWTGIGHTGDRSVADEVAHRSLVTPTACGEAVVHAVRAYLEATRARADLIGGFAQSSMEAAARFVVGARADLSRAARHELSRAESSLALGRNRAQHGARLAVERCGAALANRAERLSASGSHGVATAEQRLGQQRAILAAFDPRRQLERGWSLTRLEGGAIVRSVRDVAPGSRLVTTVADGRLRSVAESNDLAGQLPGTTPEERT